MKSARRLGREMLERMGLRPPSHWPDRGDYFNPAFVRLLRRRTIRTIFEFGCNDGEDTLRLHRQFGAEVHAFECNPGILALTRQRLAGQRGIRLIESAVWDEDGLIPFHPVVHTRQNGRTLVNPGASSCFYAVQGYHQEYEQTAVQVPSLRLETYCRQEGLEGPDLLCIDVQGAALRALRGLGAYLTRVQGVIAEIEHREVFRGEDLYPAVDACLRRAGLSQAVRIEREGWFCDYLYLRE